jgi:putative oxidoreductase
MDMASITWTVFRVGFAILYVMHGMQKLFGLFGGRQVAMGSLLSAAGVIELVGGTLLLVGLWTRPVTAILVLEMLAAFVMVHAPRGGVPLQNGGELPLLYGLAWLFFAGNGAGPVSVDAVMRRGRRVTTPREPATRAA